MSSPRRPSAPSRARPAARPVGRQPARVYWIRRGVFLGLPLVLLLILVKACSGGSSTPARATGALPSTSAAPTTRAATSSAPSAAPSTVRSVASPTAPAATAAPCQPSALKVTVATDQPSYGTGVDPVFAVTVKNVGTTRCSVDLGPGSRVVLVTTSGGQKVWSSADCDTPGSQLTDLAAGASAPRSITWSRHTSTAGSCGTAGTTSAAGTYVVGANVGTTQGATQPFVLR